jgi:hypothetical protein
MKKWEVLIIPAIALVVWILTSLFRRDEPPPQPRRRSDRGGEGPRQRRPLTPLERTLEEARRRREGPARREPKGPSVLEEVTAPRRETARPAPQAVVLELADPQAPQTSLQETRAGYTPTQSPSKAAVVKPLAPTPLVPVPAAPQTSLQETRAGYMPTQSPSNQPDEKPRPTLSPLVQVRQMLRSPQSVAAAFVLREVFGEPRCRGR